MHSYNLQGEALLQNQKAVAQAVKNGVRPPLPSRHPLLFASFFQILLSFLFMCSLSLSWNFPRKKSLRGKYLLATHAHTSTLKRKTKKRIKKCERHILPEYMCVLGGVGGRMYVCNYIKICMYIYILPWSDPQIYMHIHTYCPCINRTLFGWGPLIV